MDAFLDPCRETGLSMHLRMPVYLEILYQVARDYQSMDPRTLSGAELRFFYNGLRGELKEHTKPKG